jgi:oligoendopeptidase F
VRLSLLGHCLEGFKGTVFRQTQFAEFELKLHTMAEKGEALTGDALEALYETITRKYYGHEGKLCLVDEMVKSEWCYVPHFYYNFYVYQYATAFTASTALSVQILEGDVEARKRYLNLLSAGGSDYPIELLKTAGVDLTTSQPLELTLRKMNQIMDEMEEILQGR